jgi:quinoprotein dehydrogenase-associated probable ABC transporter substrate-binding protein
MCSGCRAATLAGIAVLLIVCPLHAGATAVPPASLLRVCADPNNLPFSNQAGEGFENALARLVARDLHRSVQYTWWPQRRGFIRNTLSGGSCDVVMGVPSSFERVLATRPYYRSAYVFVSRRHDHLHLTSLDDPRLRRLRLGLHVIGDDYNNVPPAEALASRGIVGNITGYSIYGDYSTPNPPRVLIDAVARGDIDVAIAWGPLAGFFARRQQVLLDLVPVSPQVDTPLLPMAFDIAMGVRRGDTTLRDALDEVIVRRRHEIRALLDRFGVPIVDSAPSVAVRAGR